MRHAVLTQTTDRVSQLFGDVTTSVKLQNAVSAVVNWRRNTALQDLLVVCHAAEYNIFLFFF